MKKILETGCDRGVSDTWISKGMNHVAVQGLGSRAEPGSWEKSESAPLIEGPTKI